MSGDTLRWFGTTVLAACFGLLALFGIVYLTAAGRAVPDVLTITVTGAATGFFTAFGSMIGAKASQNGAQVQSGQPPTNMGMH